MLESGREAITVSEVDSFASRLNAILVSDMSTVSGPLTIVGVPIPRQGGVMEPCSCMR